MAKTYPLDVQNVGDDSYCFMSKGHHEPHAFMAEVAKWYADAPLSQPAHKWVKAVPCRCGEHSCHYELSDEQRKGWFPATYTWEDYGPTAYKPPAAGVRVPAAPQQEPEPQLVGYEECRCILTQYCDGTCRPVFALPAVLERARTLYANSPGAYRGTRPLPWDRAPMPTKLEFIGRAKVEVGREALRTPGVAPSPQPIGFARQVENGNWVFIGFYEGRNPELPWQPVYLAHGVDGRQDDEAFRQHHRDRMAEAHRFDAKQRMCLTCAANHYCPKHNPAPPGVTVTAPDDRHAEALRGLRSLKVLLGTESPEVRGWAPAVQQAAQRTVNAAIRALSDGVMAAPALLALIERYAVEREEIAVEAHAFPGDSWKNKQPAADATLTQIRAALGVPGTVNEQEKKA